MSSRFTIARMHRDPVTNVAVHRESFPQFFADAGDASSTLAALENGANPDFFEPGRTGVFLEIHGHAWHGGELRRIH